MAKIKFSANSAEKLYFCPSCNKEGPRGRFKDYRWANSCASCLERESEAIARYLMSQSAQNFKRKTFGLGF